MNSDLTPLDLEKAKSGEPIMYRDGEPALFVAHAPTAHPSTRVITVDQSGQIRANSEAGHYYAKGESRHDLFMAPKPQEYFVNVWAEATGGGHDSLEKAMRIAGNGVLSTCKLTVLNGEVVAFETVRKYHE